MIRDLNASETFKDIGIFFLASSPNVRYRGRMPQIWSLNPSHEWRASIEHKDLAITLYHKIWRRAEKKERKYL
jgi:hypothetical protein